MKRCLSSLAPALVVLAVLAFAAPASAQFDHNVNVSATVNRACTVTTGAGADVNLSSTLTDLGNIPETPAAGLSVRCTRGTTVSVQAATASGRAVTCSALTPSCGSETIAYDLYVSQSGWGAGVAPTLLGNTAVPLGASTNKGTLATINFVARFATGVDPLAGTYTDTVAVTYTVAP
jgi:spore coat protein U-like protein